MSLKRLPTVLQDPAMAQWQTATVLADLLAEARASDLPLLSWEIGPTWTMVGRCLHDTVAQRVQAFRAWAEYLTAVPHPEFVSLGVTYLHASFGDLQGCTVVLRAELHPGHNVHGGDRS